MKMFYITLNSMNEARLISQALLQKQVAVCTNSFPINCMYRWEGEIKEGPEVVLIVKTKEGLRNEIEKVIKDHITYTNFIAELDVGSINAGFMDWLEKEGIKKI